MSEGAVAYEGVEAVLSNPSAGRVAYLGVEVVTGPPTHELSALTVQYDESFLLNIGST